MCRPGLTLAFSDITVTSYNRMLVVLKRSVEDAFPWVPLTSFGEYTMNQTPAPQISHCTGIHKRKGPEAGSDEQWQGFHNKESR